MKKSFFKKLAIVQSSAIVAAGAAHAALPTDVATVIDTAKADMLSAIGMVMVAMVAVWGLKKLASKMGWF